MNVSSYLASRPVLIWSFLSGLLGSTGTSSLRPPIDQWAASWMLRRHMHPFWTTEVEGSQLSLA
jgi:hypothetical protein